MIKGLNVSLNRRVLMQGAGALLAVSALPRGLMAQDDALVAQTSAGPVRGFSADGTLMYRGIPYAGSADGANRFLPPRPVEAWTDVRDATEFGARSPAAEYPMQVLMEEEGLDLDAGPMSEESLFLNVQTPALDGARPVMVWYHGGSFTSGSGGSMRYYAPELVVEKDVVLVTVNHRLGIFGFLDLSRFGGDQYAQSGNVGMLDIVASLEWVRDNIANFGGDPSNVTVFGESGGGSKVTTLMAMPAAEGLFHRVIAQSGVALQSQSPDAAEATTRTVLERLGIAEDDVAALGEKTWEDILAVSNGLDWRPVEDGATVAGSAFDPQARLSAGIPLLLGSNAHEANFFNATPFEPIDDEGLRMALIEGQGIAEDRVEDLIAAYQAANPDLENHQIYQRIASDAFMGASAFTAADRRAEMGGDNTWVYFFAMAQGARDGLIGAPHTAEIAYALDNLAQAERLVGAIDPEDQTLADQMSAAWTNFAREGNPATDLLPEWPAYTADNRAVMVLDENPRVEIDPLRQGLDALAAARG